MDGAKSISTCCLEGAGLTVLFGGGAFNVGHRDLQTPDFALALAPVLGFKGTLPFPASPLFVSATCHKVGQWLFCPLPIQLTRS